MVVLAALGVIAVIAVYVTIKFSQDNEQVTQLAREWALEMGIKPKAVDCVDYDTDNDGYVSCSISHEDKAGGIKIVPIECSGGMSWNKGCRSPKPSVY